MKTFTEFVNEKVDLTKTTAESLWRYICIELAVLLLKQNIILVNTNPNDKGDIEIFVKGDKKSIMNYPGRIDNNTLKEYNKFYLKDPDKKIVKIHTEFKKIFSRFPEASLGIKGNEEGLYFFLDKGDFFITDSELDYKECAKFTKF